MWQGANVAVLAGHNWTSGTELRRNKKQAKDVSNPEMMHKEAKVKNRRESIAGCKVTIINRKIGQYERRKKNPDIALQQQQTVGFDGVPDEAFKSP